jgi:hypothetical protein
LIGKKYGKSEEPLENLKTFRDSYLCLDLSMYVNKSPIHLATHSFKDELSLVLHRITMMVGALAYALFIAQLLILNNILLYSASALLGVGAALIWTGQVGFFSPLDHVPDPEFWILGASTKGQCHVIFENSLIYSQVKVHRHRRYQRQRR